MKTKSKNLSTLGILLLCAAVVLGVKTFLSLRGAQPAAVAEHAKGNPRAAVKITEYIDFQCPACAEGAKVLNKYFEQYPDKLYVELKFYPLSSHKHGLTSARYAQCVGEQGKFWEFVNLIIGRQGEWSPLTDVHDFFGTLATQVGTDPDKLKACLLDDKTDERVRKDKEAGGLLGIQKTPTYFINGNLVVGVKSLNENLTTLIGPLKP